MTKRLSEKKLAQAKALAKQKAEAKKIADAQPAPIKTQGVKTTAERAAEVFAGKGIGLPGTGVVGGPPEEMTAESGKATNVANQRGVSLETKQDMKANIALHEQDVKTSRSEEEDADIKRVLDGEDLPTAAEVHQGVYIFRSKEDFTSGFHCQMPDEMGTDEAGEPVKIAGGKRVKVRARFEGSSFTLTEEICDTFGVTMKAFVMAMIKNDRRNLSYMLVSGPGVVRTEAMIKFDKRAQAATNRRDVQVTQGVRSTGKKNG